jgi:glycosyltransferase 2 family protein
MSAPSARTRRTRWPWIILRALLSGALLLWVLHATPLATIAATLQRTDLWLLACGLALSLAARLAAAERNLSVSRALGLPLTRWQTIETLFISNFYSLLSPGPVLSGVVTVYRYNNFGASVRGSVASLLASRALECAGFMALGIVGLLIDRARFSQALQMRALLGALALLAGGAVTLGIIWMLSRQHAMRALQLMRRMGVLASWPAAAQALLGAAALVLFARALNVALPFASALWVSAAVYLAVLLPISVIGLGVREVALIKCLAVFAVPASAAVAISVLLFLDPLLNALIGGMLQASTLAQAAQRRARHQT